MPVAPDPSPVPAPVTLAPALQPTVCRSPLVSEPLQLSPQECISSHQTCARLTKAAPAC